MRGVTTIVVIAGGRRTSIDPFSVGCVAKRVTSGTSGENIMGVIVGTTDVDTDFILTVAGVVENIVGNAKIASLASQPSHYL